MNTLDIVMIVMVSSAVLLSLATFITLLVKSSKRNVGGIDVESIRRTVEEENRRQKDAISDQIKYLSNDVLSIGKNVSELSLNISSQINEMKESLSSWDRSTMETLNKNKEEIIKLFNSFKSDEERRLAEFSDKLDKSLKEFSGETNQILKERIENSDKTMKERLDVIDKNVHDSLESIRNDNNEKLTRIESTVNEKLEKTLDDRLKSSFDNVISQLSQVNQTIGEISNMSEEVVALKNTLTNVKSRGIVGEVVLGNLIKDVLVPDQYLENAVTKTGSKERVEFAIKLPGSDGENVLLPVDSKFPLDDYARIKEAIDSGDKAAVDENRKKLKGKIKMFAKDIHDKYIDVPSTTEFGIMFLPLEGLYAEVSDMGIIGDIQREYQVTIVSPSTFQAILNSLRMGFRSLSIQKKSQEVMSLMKEVKKQFDQFSDTLEKVQRNLNTTSDNMEELVGKRTRLLKKQLDRIENSGYLAEEDQKDEEKKEICE